MLLSFYGLPYIFTFCYKPIIHFLKSYLLNGVDMCIISAGAANYAVVYYYGI